MRIIRIDLIAYDREHAGKSDLQAAIDVIDDFVSSGDSPVVEVFDCDENFKPISESREVDTSKSPD